MKTLNPDQGTSKQVQDLPQSENSHWESVPAGLPGTISESSIRLSAQSPDITQKQPEADIQRVSQALALPELRIHRQQVGKGVLVKEEHIEDSEKEDFADAGSPGTMKRKATTVSQ